METYTNVLLNDDERRALHAASLSATILDRQDVDGHSIGTLRFLTRDRHGATHSKLVSARVVLVAMKAKIEDEMRLWSDASKTAPEEAPEHALIARPRQAYEMLAEIRERQLMETEEALRVIDQALKVATPIPPEEKWDV